MKKGIIEFAVLLVISKKEVYVSDLLDILTKSKLITVEGTLYPLLSRLKGQGYLAYRWEESESGPPRKYYSLTNEGKIYLETLKVEWVEIEKSIKLLLDI